MTTIQTDLNREFVSAAELTKAIDLSRSTLKRRRLEGHWVEGIHWTRLNKTCIRYNLPLIRDWMLNAHQPLVHQKVVEKYLRSVEISKKEKQLASTRA